MSDKINDPGLGMSSSYNTRMINKDGSYNVHRKGTIGGVKDFYQFLLSLSWTRFNMLVLGYLIVFNLIFAALYFLIGVEHIGGVNKTDSLQDLLYSFYFSVQTMSGVGYGSFFPKGHAVLMISSFEALFGLLSIALVTGVLFGRFSKPNAKIRYSNNMLIAPYRDKKAFMFRIANARNSAMMEMSATLMATMVKRDQGGNLKREYFSLDLEIERIHFFPVTWTIVHPISPESPLFGYTFQELAENHLEFLILIKGYDERFSQEVVSRHSYIASEIIENAQFLPAIEIKEDGQVIVDLHTIDLYKKVL